MRTETTFEQYAKHTILTQNKVNTKEVLVLPSTHTIAKCRVYLFFVPIPIHMLIQVFLSPPPKKEYAAHQKPHSTPFTKTFCKGEHGSFLEIRVWNANTKQLRHL